MRIKIIYYILHNKNMSNILNRTSNNNGCNVMYKCDLLDDGVRWINVTLN